MPHWYAPIGPRTDQRIRQFRAWIEPGKGIDDLVREEMGWPRVVVAAEHPDGVYLYRFTAEGEDAGDTLHESFDDARHQADFEYTSALGEWREVPASVPEAGLAEFALSAAEM